MKNLRTPMSDLNTVLDTYPVLDVELLMTRYPFYIFLPYLINMFTFE